MIFPIFRIELFLDQEIRGNPKHFSEVRRRRRSWRQLTRNHCGKDVSSLPKNKRPKKQFLVAIGRNISIITAWKPISLSILFS